MNIFLLVVFIVLILVVFLVILFVARRNMAIRDGCIFTVTKEGLEEQTLKIKEKLETMKVSKSEIANALLLMEETVVRMQAETEFAMTVRLSKIFGRPRIILSSPGRPFNLLASIQNNKNQNEDSYRDMIFEANKKKIVCLRRINRNIVIIRVGGK